MPYAKHSDKIANNRAYAKANPEKMREWRATTARNARKRTGSRHNGAEYREIVVGAIRERDGDNCHVCGGGIEFGKNDSIDHVIPVCRGGLHRLGNVKLAHRKCNLQRYNEETRLSVN